MEEEFDDMNEGKNSNNSVEDQEQQVLAMGNEILRILGAEETITDIESFTYDSLYLQLFEAFFPNLNLEEIQPGETAEEMAANI